MNKKLILASTSPYRKALLEKLNLPFSTAKPDTDETPLANETALELVERLAIAKAQVIAKQHSNAIIIGSDQVCVSHGDILGKPGNYENAFAQLKAASGNKVTFYTGLAVIDSETQQVTSLVEPYIVHFRQLTDEMIDHYLTVEQPYDCAGSFKSEGFGISLFGRLEGRDPNSLIGLPLISLIEILDEAGLRVI
ncbi:MULTISPECIES: Maf family protein [unclassified Motilimonas]|uniref:Maf family protein n=1 Tax=Motilimonas TaxID=1914248 RepID=UPI001E633BEB|nr:MULTISPECIES: Maf family protein [unclassified Motilimonas]MCE0556937.1 Maf-like protein [Motilimonas sp. E26]MDO6525512.1 Maf family protein [Motilimonas sp. 1_MG-2023]